MFQGDQKLTVEPDQNIENYIKVYDLERKDHLD